MFSPQPASSPASPLESLAALRDHFRSTPALVLLRAENAPYILHFFQLAFRKSAQISIPSSTLRMLLQNYLDERRAEEPGSEWSTPEVYLREWTNSRYLHSYYPDDGDDPHYQLTAEAQRVLGWIDALRQRSLIVTESRLQLIFSTLEEIIDNATANPATRIAQLERQRDEINAEIAHIASTNEVQTYSPAKLSERFELVRQQAAQLVEDFAAVEEKFKGLVVAIQQQQAEHRLGRGEVLGQALDAEERLWQTDHGQSFDAFCGLLMDEERQRRFEEFVEMAYGLEQIDPALRSDGFLRRLRPNLTRASEKVLATNRRLARQLRRVLSEDGAKESRLAASLAEFRRLAAALRAADHSRLPGMKVSFETEIVGLADRRRWDRQPPVAFPETLTQGQDGWSAEALAQFALLESFDLEPLRTRVARALETQPMLTLGELLRQHPLEHGVTELIGYFLVASGYQQAGAVAHHIDRNLPTTVEIPGTGKVHCPDILFCRA